MTSTKQTIFLMTNSIAPTKTVTEMGGTPVERYDHPSYGVITLLTSSGNTNLFGSDLTHNQVVSIKIDTAYLNRSLGRDWIHSDRQIVEVEMSHAQFAQFITSNGQGSGTPCTIRRMAGQGGIPGIEHVETKHQMLHREILDSAKAAIDEISAEVKALEELAESGKVSAKALKEIVRNLKNRTGNLPSNMAYTIKTAQQTLEKATSDAKIEVEAFVSATAQRLGLDSINQLALENKAKKD